jgi:hypothetical protein
VKRSPCKRLKKFVGKKNRIIAYARSFPSCKKSLWKNKTKKYNEKNNDYGVHTLEPELEKEDFEKEKKRIFFTTSLRRRHY